MREIKIVYLYPDMLNLYGDRGRVIGAAGRKEAGGRTSRLLPFCRQIKTEYVLRDLTHGESDRISPDGYGAYVKGSAHRMGDIFQLYLSFFLPFQIKEIDILYMIFTVSYDF